VQHKRWWLDGVPNAGQNSVGQEGRYITVYMYMQ